MQNMLKYDLPSVQNFYKILRIPASLAQQRNKKRDFQFDFFRKVELYSKGDKMWGPFY